MTEHKYSVREIDEMRDALTQLGHLHAFGTANGCDSDDLRRAESRVEDQLRTYMTAGTRAPELRAHYVEQAEKYCRLKAEQRERVRASLKRV